MAIYELRTYTFQVGKLDQAKTLYIEKGWPALEKYQDKLVGYLVSDVGPLNQLVHLWRFANDEDRRSHWDTLFADRDFMEFAGQLRALEVSQENRLLTSAPWGPAPGRDEKFLVARGKMHAIERQERCYYRGRQRDGARY